MGRRAKKIVAAAPQRATIESLTHEGRGVARVGGKAVFIDGALPGEEVSFTSVRRFRTYEEGRLEAVLHPAPERVEPRCSHFGVCGGCSLQHYAPEAQIAAKQKILLDNLARIGKVEPGAILPPLVGPPWGYRRKARLGVRFVRGKGRVLVGFRELRNSYLAELSRCEVLHPSVGERLADLAALIGGMAAFDQIAQIEVAIGDDTGALVFRHLAPLGDADLARLRAFGQDTGLQIWLQPAGPETAHPFAPEQAELYYGLPEFDLTLWFLPTDFTQVNADINRLMIPHALALLDPGPGERVLDLFCGLGNFSLPLARRAAEVVGVEGEAGLVRRAAENARRNAISNAQFYTANLAEDVSALAWRRQRFDKILIDPPRSGASEVLGTVAAIDARRLVYVSCNPATLARDAGELVHRYGFRLRSAGVMDMFPHTAHVESIALFER